LVFREDGEIIWRDFGFENTYEPNIALGDYSGVGPFRFDAVRYESALVAALDSLKVAKP
jgi:hypothetical protein